MTIDLRPGKWQDALADVGQVDAIICDPPFSERTHSGQRHGTGFADGGTRTNLSYDHWTPADVQEFVAHWSPRTRGWMACMTDSTLILVWQEAYKAAGRLDFAPVPCLRHRPRMTGDGPGSGAIYLMVARPRRKEFLSWGTLPCWYGPIFAPAVTTSKHIGGKPLEWMLAILRDYSKPGDLVCDPCSGGGTTAVAAHQTGRRFVGSECDPTTYAKARLRVDKAMCQQHLLPAEVGEAQARLL